MVSPIAVKHCGCWYEWRVDHDSPEGCEALQYKVDMDLHFNVAACGCCGYVFFNDQMVYDRGDPSVGQFSSMIFAECVGENCEHGEARVREDADRKFRYERHDKVHYERWARNWTTGPFARAPLG